MEGRRNFRVLLLSEESYPRHPGGSGKVTHVMAAGLVARGHTVHLLSLTGGEGCQEVIDGVRVHRVAEPTRDTQPSREREALIARHILEYVRREIPPHTLDLVHDSGGFLSYFFPLEHELRRAHALPLAVHFRYLLMHHQMVIGPTRDYDPFGAGVLGLEACIGETTQCFPVRIADLIISPSREDATLVAGLYRSPPGILRVVPDPVQLAPADPARSGITRCRLARPGESLVLFGGRIGNEGKGAEAVLDAFRRIRRSRAGVRLLLASPDGPTVQLFRRHLGDDVTALGWIEDELELAAILGAVDLVLVPSHFESFGLMCAEAMAAGTPVIAAPVGGHNDMLADGDTGVLLGEKPERWGEELAAHMLALLGDRERLARMGKAARAYAVANLELGRVCQRLEALYGELVAGRRAPAADAGIRPPELGGRDRERYLALLSDTAGQEAAAAGAATFEGWTTNIEERCLACSRQRIADDTRALLRLGRPRWRERLTASPDRRRQSAAAAVQAACPLALLQKELVRREIAAGGIAAGRDMEGT